MTELYDKLLEIEGIKAFRSCYLTKSSNNEITDIVSDFSNGYSLSIPESQEKIKVKIRTGESEVEITYESFYEELKAIYALNKSSLSDYNDNDKSDSSRKFIPKGTYRDVFRHREMGKDFPACYNLNTKAKDSQFATYLQLFDTIIQNGLKELKETKKLLSVNENDAVLSNAKNKYLDFLDHLYQVNSNPDWITEFRPEEETDIDRVNKRMTFLRNVPYLTQTRSRAYNIYKERSDRNIATIKAHLSYLLGLNMDENISACKYEAVYVLEHHLFDPEASFTVSLFFSGWMKRFQSGRGRKACNQFVRTLLPAHLTANIYWLDAVEMNSFEVVYTRWTDALYNRVPQEVLNKIQKELQDIILKLTQE